MEKNIRNIAIIAHVDHGKTTLVDALLRQSEDFAIKQETKGLIMDSNELERERGITIFSKNASIKYKDFKINIVDTPGHADFGGEVERIMSMVQGVLLLVDAKDGPMPQTKFVLKKALEAGHRVIVVINKIDLQEARPDWVLNRTFDLFVELGATSSQAEFPVLYASALEGKAGFDPNLATMENVQPLFDTIIKEIPGPPITSNPTQMLVVNTSYDNYKGPIAVGFLAAGTLQKNQQVMRIKTDGTNVPSRITAVMTFDGLNRIEVDEVEAGDIVDAAVLRAERLERELLNDVALRVESVEDLDSSFTVSGRGEFHLAILVEKMRREGYEFQVGKPEVIFKEENGKTLEPFEDIYIECPEQYSGTVIEKVGSRKGEMLDMKVDRGIVFLHFLVSTRGLIGYRSEFLTDTKGEGIFNTLFHGYKPSLGDIKPRNHGSLIAYETGTSNTYGLLNAQERGQLFVGPGVSVYKGMIVGKNAKPQDLEVNICKTKQLSNMRSKGEGVSEHFDTPLSLSLEECIEYLGDDELLEVTPKSLRLRKVVLSALDRKRSTIHK
ncbi:MAG: GTP-binding protein [Parcubacteria group bacterium Greene0416_39]|nr:MAG: GTP-binding protein [Parcubacteria group bacterium Greene0416_39]